MDNSPLKILAIDDEATYLKVLQALLTEAFPNAKFFAAENGPDGLELARQKDPDVILLDIMMAGMDGFEVCRQLKSDDRLRHIPVVFLTGARSDRDSRIQALETGGEGFLAKPVDVVELTAEIRVMAKVKMAGLLQRVETDRLAAMVEDRTRDLERELAKHKRAVEALANEHSLLAATLESTADGVLVIDRAGKVTGFNQNFLRLWRIPDALMAERDDKQLLQYVLDQLQCPEDFLSKVQALYQNPEATSMDEIRFKDGRILERYSRPQQLDATIVGRVWSFRDITERKRAEESLRRAEEKFRNIFDNAAEGIYQSTPDGVLLSVNPAMATIHGYDSPEEFTAGVRDIAGQLYADPSRREEFKRRLEKQGEVNGMENQVRRKDGSLIWVSTNARAVRDANGKILFYEGTVQDITERKQANEKLQRDQLAMLNMLEDQRRAEQAARQSQHRYQQLVDHARDGIFTLGADGRFLFVNEGICNLLGYTPEELLRLTIFDTYSDESREGGRQRLAKIERGEATQFERPMKRKDGSFVTIEASAWRTEDGHVQAIVRDITEHKRSEAALRESEEQFRTMADFTYDWEFWIGPDGQFRYVSPSCLRITGYGAIKFQQDPDLFLRIIHPEDKVAMAEHLAWETAAPPCSLDFRIVTRGGEVRWLNHVCQPVFRADGTCLGRRASNRDITERKQMEEERVRLAAAIEQAAETIMITDAQANILYVNPSFEKITGYTRAEALGQNPRILKSGKHDAEFYRQMWDTLSKGEVWHGHFINKRKDNTIFEEDATISPVRDASGRIVNYISLKLDVTRETELQIQLNHAMKMDAIGRLAGGVAHDFNNLLNVILGYAEMALTKIETDNPLFKQVSQIKKAAERAAALTRQLRAFSRKQIGELCVLDLNALLTDLDPMLRRLVREDVEFTLSLTPNLGRIRADSTQIEQVVTNLVANAQDAMPQGGKLIIETANLTLDSAHAESVAPPGEYIQLTIRDTGIGMTDEVKAHLFEPFFTTKPVGKGTGLGLAICYGAIKQNGGHILVESAVGQGATFRLRLPRFAERQSRKRDAKISGALPLGTETILLVEDDADVRQLAEAMLTRLGYKVLVAAGGEDALRIAAEKAGTIHLLVTDVVMPQMNGKQLADELLKRHPQIKVLFVSGYISQEIADNGAFERDTLLLQKPYSAFALATKAREALEQKQRNPE
jgi:PAS domain S-box-containing protein